MLMVIFGAGASFGSRPGSNPELAIPTGDGIRRFRRPPLTKTLFSDALASYTAEYPASRPLIVLLREHMSANPDALIEEVLGGFAEEASSDQERARHMLAFRFYLCELIAKETQRWWEQLNGFTHYADLLARLGRWRASTGELVALVTFNYDELLDRSVVAQAGNWRLNDFASYTARHDWRLYKLHGSIGWCRALPRPDGTSLNAGPNELIPRAHELDLAAGALMPEPWERAKDHMIPNVVIVPGIAVPTDRKDTFECPPEHLDSFVSEVTKVDRVLTIGWRAAEQHVQEILSEHLQPGYHLAICDIASEAVSTVFGNLGLAGRKAVSPQMFTEGFTGLLGGSELERWLNRPLPGTPRH